MSNKTSVTLDPALGQVVILFEGDAVAWTITVPSVVTSITSPTMTMYRQNSGSDVSSTYFTGSLTVSGFDITTKTTQNLKAGDWIVNVNATVDGITYCVYRFPLIVKRLNQV
jgi:hypothetical protein